MKIQSPIHIQEGNFQSVVVLHFSMITTFAAQSKSKNNEIEENPNCRCP